MKYNNIYMILIYLISVTNILFADIPDWEDNPGMYEFTATIVGVIILKNGVNTSDIGDRLAAFDDNGNIRGLAYQLQPPFGPFTGEYMYEITLRSNIENDKISFKYYDISEDEIFDVIEEYTFISNDQLGSVIDPLFYNTLYMNIDKHSNNQFILGQNYPNPYNPNTAIEYFVASISTVTLNIFDIRGNLIIELINKMHTPGQYNIFWNSSDIAAGVYLIKMNAYSINKELIFTTTNKMLYIK